MSSVDRRKSRSPLRQQGALPLSVYRDFVDMLFSMWLPIAGMGMVVSAVAVAMARELNDLLLLIIAGASAALTVMRLLMIGAYHRAAPRAEGDLRRWEIAYAWGSYAFALLLGVFNTRTLVYDQPLLHLLSISLFFALGAGLVSRISIRPAICVVSVLLTAAPTCAGLLMRALVPGAQSLNELYGVEAFLVFMITVLSLQTVAHLHRSAVQHHTAEHDMARLAKYDALTGLGNRLLLRERFQPAISTQGIALHFIDLDGFKPINDKHGHPAGDLVLKEVAKRLEATVRGSDIVARLGGDEFVILQANVTEASEAELLARRIIKRLSAPIDIGEVSVSISGSVGIARSEDFGCDLDLLLSCADQALYRSKAAGKNRLNFSNESDFATARQAA